MSTIAAPRPIARSLDHVRPDRVQIHITTDFHIHCDDGALLACALAARADFIISRDERERNIKHCLHLRIINATETLAIVDR